MPIGPYFRHLSISVDWLTSQARYVRVGFPRRTLPRFIWFTMPSLSQALLLEDLPSSHSAFQGHAAHTARWPAMLRPKGSWGACTPHGIIHSSTVLHGADLYTQRCYHILPYRFTAHRADAGGTRLHALVRRCYWRTPHYGSFMKPAWTKC